MLNIINNQIYAKKTKFPFTGKIRKFGNTRFSKGVGSYSLCKFVSHFRGNLVIFIKTKHKYIHCEFSILHLEEHYLYRNII